MHSITPFYLGLLLCISCQSPSAGDKQIKLLNSDTVAACAVASIPSRFVAPAAALSFEKGKDKVKMLLIPAGRFEMGSADFEDSKPIHTVELKAFYMDEHEVTQAQYAAFVQATGYITVAERALNPADFPGVDPAMLVPGSAVFQAPQQLAGLSNHLQWWSYVPGASWRYPEGPKGISKGKDKHPVTQVAYQDSQAYAEWVGKRLPTEAEWEYAAKAGQHKQEIYYWGNELKQDGKWLANIFQGEFPKNNSQEDGFAGTAPVKSYPANAWGLYDMEGNVWEWCADYYRPDYYSHSPVQSPKGPQDSYDPQEPQLVKRVQRGGSFLCNDQYCERYKAGSRGKGEENSPTNNVGFRCVQDVE